MVRTPGFHPGNRGSIPRGVTKIPHGLSVGIFVFSYYLLTFLYFFASICAMCRFIRVMEYHRVLFTKESEDGIDSCRKL